MMSKSDKNERDHVLANDSFMIGASHVIGMDKEFFVLVMGQVSALVDRFDKRLPFLLRAPVSEDAGDMVMKYFGLDDQGRRTVH